MSQQPDRVYSGGRGNGGHGGRGGRGGRLFEKRWQGPGKRQEAFEGRIKELKGLVIFNCLDSRQADMFTKSLKELVNYVGTTFTKGQKLARTAVETLTVPTISLPADLPTTATKAEQKAWEKEIDLEVVKKATIAENMSTIFSIVWLQWTTSMQEKLKELKNFKKMLSDQNGVELLIEIRTICFNFQLQRKLTLSLV